LIHKISFGDNTVTWMNYLLFAHMNKIFIISVKWKEMDIII